MTELALTSYRFIVTLDPVDAYLSSVKSLLFSLLGLGSPQFTGGAFQEVRGLGADLEVTSYAEGGVNDFAHQLPVRHTWTRISLKRGLVRDPGLWSWYSAGLNEPLGARRDGSIILLTHSGERAMAWNFHAGIAVKWQGPELNAMQNAVAIETLEIAHHGVNQVPLSPPDSE